MRVVYRTINVVLLLLMISVIAVFLFWKMTPTKLNAAGTDIIMDYVTKGEERTAKALEGLSQGDSSFAEKTLEAWEDIGNDDRYYKHKRKILLSLSNHLLGKGEYKKSVDFMSSSILENDRDIMLFIEWVKSALHIPELKQAAESELTVMVKRFPDHPLLNTLYINDVLYKGDEAAAEKALSQIRGMAPKVNGWSVLWTLDSRNKYEKRVWTKLKLEDRHWALDVSLPRTATKFRVDLPRNVRMDISDIQFTSEGQSLAYTDYENVDVNMMQVDADVLSADGLNDPYFVVTLPEWLRGPSDEGMVNAKVTFSITNVGIDGKHVVTREERTLKALEGLSKGEASYAEKVLEEWEDSENDDRYDKNKRKIMLSLSKHFLETGEYKNSAYFMSSSIREYDPDIMSFINWVKSALYIPELEKIAESELSIMVKRFPDHARLKTLYVEDVLYKGGQPPKVGGWSVLWTLGASKKYTKRVWAKLKLEDRHWAVDVSVPRTATKFRVDLPPNVRMDISDIQFTSEDQSLAYTLDQDVDVNMMQVDGDVLSADGLNDPYFVIATPEWLRTPSDEGMVNAKITFAITNVELETEPSK